MRTLEWDPITNKLRMIDQRWLPGRFEWVFLETYQEVADAIQTMVVRGAPAIGAAAAFGLALAAFQSAARDRKTLVDELKEADRILRNSRPTAVNLAWGLDRMMIVATQFSGTPEEIRERLLAEAQTIADEDVEINRSIARHGVELIQEGDTIIHHCNTGSLATVEWGTALGVIRMAHEMGKKIHVLVDETRPRLQGARLTAWELDQYRISYEIITDGAAGYFLRTGQAQKVLFGADRVASNGDVANKVGSYMLALAAFDNGVPVYSVFPTSTIDLAIQQGREIPIEERDQDEVLGIQIHNERIAPKNARARNPAFDITPHRLFSGLVTEKGVIYPPFHLNLPEMVRKSTPRK
jgi:methylthioribose-1-phosphate isomerase